MRQFWTRSASSLLSRQHDLRSLRVGVIFDLTPLLQFKRSNQTDLQFYSTSASSKYQELSAPRLTSLAQSKYEQLLKSCAEETRPFLLSFVELSGVANSFSFIPTQAPTEIPSTLVRCLPPPRNVPHQISSYCHNHYPFQLQQLTTLPTSKNSGSLCCGARNRIQKLLFPSSRTQK